MKVKVEELSSVERQITVEIPGDQVSRTIDNLYKRLQRQSKLKGFRPGKAPRSVLERYYAPQVAAETAESLIGDHYTAALQEAQVEPLARPQFDFQPPAAGQDFVFSMTLDVRPVLELDPASYKGLELKEPDLEVTDEVVDQELDRLRQRQAVLLPVEEERPAEIGEVLVVDYESFVGDEPLSGGKADNVEVELGGGQIQQEIELALVKAKPGDHCQAVVSYPEDASDPAVAGKEVRFELAVKALKRKVLPELDDDFARGVSPEFKDLASLTKRIRDEIEQTYRRQKDMTLRNQILDQIRELGEFDMPASLVEEETQEMLKNFKDRLRAQGADLDAGNLDDSSLAQQFKAQAERKVRAGIVLGHISDQEKVEVDDKDIEAEIERVAAQVNQPVGVVKEMYIKNNMMDSLRAQLLEDKTLQAIKADAIITKVDPEQLAKESAPPAAPEEEGAENEKSQV